MRLQTVQYPPWCWALLIPDAGKASPGQSARRRKRGPQSGCPEVRPLVPATLLRDIETYLECLRATAKPSRKLCCNGCVKRNQMIGKSNASSFLLFRWLTSQKRFTWLFCQRHMTWQTFFNIPSMHQDVIGVTRLFPLTLDLTPRFYVLGRNSVAKKDFKTAISTVWCWSHHCWKSNLGNHPLNLTVKRMTGASLLKDEGALALMFCKSSSWSTWSMNNSHVQNRRWNHGQQLEHFVW